MSDAGAESADSPGLLSKAWGAAKGAVENLSADTDGFMPGVESGMNSGATATGAAMGATLGSAAGPVGTVGGAVVGGLAGYSGADLGVAGPKVITGESDGYDKAKAGAYWGATALTAAAGAPFAGLGLAAYGAAKGGEVVHKAGKGAAEGWQNAGTSSPSDHEEGEGEGVEPEAQTVEQGQGAEQSQSTQPSETQTTADPSSTPRVGGASGTGLPGSTRTANTGTASAAGWGQQGGQLRGRQPPMNAAGQAWQPRQPRPQYRSQPTHSPRQGQGAIPPRQGRVQWRSTRQPGLRWMLSRGDQSPGDGRTTG